MGIIITGYSHIKLIDQKDDESYSEIYGHSLIHIHAALRLVNNPNYSMSMSGFVPGGVYETDAEYQTSVNHLGWHRFKNNICSMVIDLYHIHSYKGYKGNLFRDLIAHSKHDGMYDSSCSASIYNDLREYRRFCMERIKAVDPENREGFILMYRDLLRVFKLGSRNGCVEFC